jgi:hypothetical protein
MAVMSVLKSQHDEKEGSYDSENNSQEALLSDICPKIFKLSFNTHGQHFAFLIFLKKTVFKMCYFQANNNFTIYLNIYKK